MNATAVPVNVQHAFEPGNAGTEAVVHDQRRGES